MALVTLEEARTVLGFPASEDDLYTFLIASASAVIEKITKQKFEETEVTEQLDGGFAELILRYRPVSSVESVKDFADPDNPITLDADTDYTLYPERGYLVKVERGSAVPGEFTGTFGLELLIPIGPIWAGGVKRWEVAYTAGEAAGVPADIKQAAIQLIAFYAAMAEQSGGAFQSETIGDYSYTLASGQMSSSSGIPPSIFLILKNYIEPSF
jgi:hypothetical protein